MGLIPFAMFIDMVLRLLGIRIPEDPVLTRIVTVIGMIGGAILGILLVRRVHRRLIALKG